LATRNCRSSSSSSSSSSKGRALALGHRNNCHQHHHRRQGAASFFSTIVPNSQYPETNSTANNNEAPYRPFDDFPDNPPARWARRNAIRDHGAPKSIALIATGTESAKNKSVAIRDMGCGRRLFLLDSHLSGDTMEGLAYRLNLLKTNAQLSSLLLATDGTDDSDTALRLLHERHAETSVDYDYRSPQGATDDEVPPQPGQTFYVCGGYDPLTQLDTPEMAGATLQHLHGLSAAIRGGTESKIPLITVPHGALTDGGAALLLSSYVLATHETSFRILNPRRGLSLDPTGLSYWLTRVGQEFDQPSQHYAAGVALILALTGYTANAHDLVETGLATHYLGSPANVPILEENLMEVPAWKYQEILRPNKQYDGHGQPGGGHQQRRQRRDINASFRNVQVANLIMDITEYSADGIDIMSVPDSVTQDPIYYDGFLDPSLDAEFDNDGLATEPEWRTSHLVNYAATFGPLLAQSPNIVHVYGEMKELANNAKRVKVEPEDQALAQLFCRGIEAASPLATVVTDQLLRRGNPRPSETLESCLQRELMVQTKMAALSPDFQTWRENGGQAPKRWCYPDVASVPRDQVEEMLAPTF